MAYQEYAEVPWYRKSSTNSALLLLQLLTWEFFPLSLFVCIMLFIGDIYLNKKEANGNLKRWGFANKIAAAVFCAVCLALLIFNPYRRVR
ncbi:MAG: hypothetical protein ABSF38_02555 [Verrucomicrobiota bacterium]|jgi:hypothetical protein